MRCRRRRRRRRMGGKSYKSLATWLAAERARQPGGLLGWLGGWLGGSERRSSLPNRVHQDQQDAHGSEEKGSSGAAGGKGILARSSRGPRSTDGPVLAVGREVRAQLTMPRMLPPGKNGK